MLTLRINLTFERSTIKQTMARGKSIFFSLFTLLGLVNAHQAFPGRILNRASEVEQSYDYVVVGGGLSGLVVANRLSENPGKCLNTNLTNSG